jgi:hypothetical protein
MKTHHVLYIEHDNAAHEVSVHEDLRAAQLALREYADDLVEDEEVAASLDEKGVVETLSEYGIYVRIYRCSDEGSVECPVEDRVEQSIA